MRNIRATIAALGLVLAACGGGDTPTTPNNPPGGGGGGGGSTTNMINVGDSFFSPIATTVPVGTTVTWTFSGVLQHNVTFSNASIGNSNNMASGTFTKTFAAAGSFPYQCTIHGASMSGTITVQ